MALVYQVVPGPTMVQTTGGGASEKAAELYGGIINRMAREGWVFVCFDDTIVKNTTCFGCSTDTFPIKLLVFSRNA
jgi:hypothetical protein